MYKLDHANILFNLRKSNKLKEEKTLILLRTCIGQDKNKNYLNE